MKLPKPRVPQKAAPEGMHKPKTHSPNNRRSSRAEAKYEKATGRNPRRRPS